jgi:hypothetical protein
MVIYLLYYSLLHLLLSSQNEFLCFL